MGFTLFKVLETTRAQTQFEIQNLCRSVLQLSISQNLTTIETLSKDLLKGLIKYLEECIINLL